MARVLLFDFDGTIADSMESFLEIIQTLSKKYKFTSIPRDDVARLRSEGAKSILKTLRIPVYKLPSIILDMKHLQQKEIHRIKPIPGIPEVLQTLKKSGYTMGIITSNARENVEEFLRQYKISVFDYIHCDTSIFGKDKVLRSYIKQYALTIDDIIYIGDEIRDIQACKKAGVKIIAVTWGFNSKEGLVKYHPDSLVYTPADLLKLI